MKQVLRNCVIVLHKDTFEVIGYHTLKIKPLPKLSQYNPWKLTIMSNYQLMAINPFQHKAFIYENRNWTFHSHTPRNEFMCNMVCTLPTGICVTSKEAIEFLEKGSSNWVTRNLELKNQIEVGLPLSNNEMVVWRGKYKFQQNLEKFNLNSLKIENFLKFRMPRRGCAICIYNGKLFVTGGQYINREKLRSIEIVRSTEIISLSDLHYEKSADMNIKRVFHSMAIVGSKLIVFGGSKYDHRVEEWDDEEKKWKFSNLTTSSNALIFENYTYSSLVE